MPERQYRTLTKRIVDRLAVNGKDGVFWDSELPGFGIRVYPTGRKVYVVQARANGKSRRVTVGRHGDVAPDQARKDAAEIIARLKAGLPPVEQEPEPEPTVADLAERYEREYVAMHCKPNTIKHYREAVAIRSGASAAAQPDEPPAIRKKAPDSNPARGARRECARCVLDICPCDAAIVFPRRCIATALSLDF